MFTLCYRMVGNYFEAQDLTQETFLSAWSALDRFDGQHEKAWLCRIAANKCTDFLRRHGCSWCPTERRPCPGSQTPPGSGAAGAGTGGSGGAAVCLRNTERALPPTALLYFVEERSFQEIADNTGQNLKTVQTRVYRAKAQLKKLIRKEQVL